jgi:hypothetical protein
MWLWVISNLCFILSYDLELRWYLGPNTLTILVLQKWAVRTRGDSFPTSSKFTMPDRNYAPYSSDSHHRSLGGYWQGVGSSLMVTHNPVFTKGVARKAQGLHSLGNLCMTFRNKENPKLLCVSFSFINQEKMLCFWTWWGSIYIALKWLSEREFWLLQGPLLFQNCLKFMTGD